VITSPAVVRAATRVLGVVPVGPIRALARFAGSAVSPLLRARRRTVLESLAYLRPGLTAAQRRQLARRTFGNFAAASVDLLRLPSASREELLRLVTFSGLEYVDAALRLGNGAIVVTAHMGPYELGGACLAARGYQASAVVENLAPEVMEALSTFREATGMRLIGLDRAVVGTLRALKENGVALLVADRVVGRGTKGVALPFASGIRRVPTGPANFAITSGAPIIVAHIIKSRNALGAQYAVHFDPPIFADPSKARDTNEMDLTRQVSDRLASLIAAHPDQWFVFQPEWQQGDASGG